MHWAFHRESGITFSMIISASSNVASGGSLTTWLTSRRTVSVSNHQAAVTSDRVSEPKRCSSLFWGCHLHHTPVNVAWCHRQVLCEDDEVHKHKGRFHQDIGLVSLLVIRLQKLPHTHRIFFLSFSCFNSALRSPRPKFLNNQLITSSFFPKNFVLKNIKCLPNKAQKHLMWW